MKDGPTIEFGRHTALTATSARAQLRGALLQKGGKDQFRTRQVGNQAISKRMVKKTIDALEPAGSTSVAAEMNVGTRRKWENTSRRWCPAFPTKASTSRKRLDPPRNFSLS
jgi:hypothetical protein